MSTPPEFVIDPPSVIEFEVQPPSVVHFDVIPGQGPAGVPGIPVVQITSILYDGQNRVTSYVQDGSPHTVTYPDEFTMVDVGGGYTKTITFDGLQRVISVINVPT